MPIIYIPDAITAAQEAALLGHFEESAAAFRGIHANTTSGVNRKIMQFGYEYNYLNFAAPPARCASIPAWMEETTRRISAIVAGATKRPFVSDQIIVNRYEPGEGIGPHVDHKRWFGPVIASLSLASAVTMHFAHAMSGQSCFQRLEPRSLLILSDGAAGNHRSEWTHEIRSVHSDRVDGVLVRRSLRYSVTLREMR